MDPEKARARKRLAELELQWLDTQAELMAVLNRLGELRPASREIDRLRSRNRQLQLKLEELGAMVELYRLDRDREEAR